MASENAASNSARVTPESGSARSIGAAYKCQSATAAGRTGHKIGCPAPRPGRGAGAADLASVFSADHSHYIYGVEGLAEFLSDEIGPEFAELVEETQFVHDDPRTLTEIMEAEQEFFDKIWYVRSLIREEKVAATGSGSAPAAISEAAQAAMRAIEDKYGAESVGPWDDWGWGFVHDKLSALRWVLGSEWDFLDT